MAHLHWHGRIIREWKQIEGQSHTKFYLTETGWILRTTGIRGGNAKVIAKPKEEERKAKIFHFLSDTARYSSTIL